MGDAHQECHIDKRLAAQIHQQGIVFVSIPRRSLATKQRHQILEKLANCLVGTCVGVVVDVVTPESSAVVERGLTAKLAIDNEYIRVRVVVEIERCATP